MQRAADLYERKNTLFPELLLCSDAMYNGLDILRPHLEKRNPKKNTRLSSVLLKVIPKI